MEDELDRALEAYRRKKEVLGVNTEGDPSEGDSRDDTQEASQGGIVEELSEDGVIESLEHDLPELGEIEPLQDHMREAENGGELGEELEWTFGDHG